MEDIKNIIAKNISTLRKENKFTQLELAEKMNYSDKAVSRWERGETLPDIDVLLKLCDLFNVKFEYLITENPTNEQKKKSPSKAELGNKLTITLLAISIVWLIATFVYVYSGIIFDTSPWKIFIWAVPTTFLVAEIANFFWGNKKIGLGLLSGFTWTILVAMYIQFLSLNMWLIFLLGVPIQVSLILWFNLKPKHKG